MWLTIDMMPPIKQESTMVRYLSLISFTDQGIRSIDEASEAPGGPFAVRWRQLGAAFLGLSGQ